MRFSSLGTSWPLSGTAITRIGAAVTATFLAIISLWPAVSLTAISSFAAALPASSGWPTKWAGSLTFNE